MSKHIKRSIDLVVASTAVVILAPVMAIIAAAILVKMGLPILFRQVRPGYHGRLFELVKFRTLREGAYHDGRPLPIKERITPLGHFLRRTSLDELPQLWNVIKGDMSLVGPPPAAGVVLAPLHPGTRASARGEAWTNGHGSSEGTASPDMERSLFARRVVRRHWSLYMDMKIMAWTLKQALEGKGTAPPDADDYTLRELKGMITTSPTHVSQPPHEPPVMRSRRRWSSGE